MTLLVLFISLTISPSIAGSKKLRGGDWQAMTTGGLADAVSGRANVINFASEELGKVIC